MKRIILITGGARSGKSTYAERLALRLSPTPIYIATARIWDDEFRQRVIKHQERRGNQWTNIEEEKWLSHHDVTGQTVLIDCLTLWATNFFFDNANETSPQPNEPDPYRDGACLHPTTAAPQSYNVDILLDQMRQEFTQFTSQDATFIFVTNEIGMGGTSPNQLQRHFTDLLGILNQYVASQADEVILMVSGIPLKVKSKT